MAGDWIKVEHATLDKPEVLRTAEMLGISRRETVGLFVEYFFWLDKTLSENCPDFVRNVSRKSLDEMMHCAGFAACLEAVGWAQFDDSAWTLRVINASNHNGKPAKTRAVDAKRKAGKRLESVREMSGENRTREDKNRTIELRSIGARPTRIPSDWCPSLADLAFAQGRLRADAVAGQVEAFRTYWQGAVKNATSPDWSAKWRTWVMKAVRDFGAAPASRQVVA
jgi:hypothetical protein